VNAALQNARSAAPESDNARAEGEHEQWQIAALNPKSHFPVRDNPDS
jgi:hypothetical protein